MIFEPVTYSHLLQDFLFSGAAGFAVAFLNQLLASVFPSGKRALFVREIAVSFLFAVALFSYVISFTNYPVIRFYHLLGGLGGFFAFPWQFSTFFQKNLQIFLKFVKNKIWCLCGKIKSIICAKRQKQARKKTLPQDGTKNDHLKNEDSLIYNL